MTGRWKVGRSTRTCADCARSWVVPASRSRRSGALAIESGSRVELLLFLRRHRNRCEFARADVKIREVEPQPGDAFFLLRHFLLGEVDRLSHRGLVDAVSHCRVLGDPLITIKIDEALLE